MKHRVALAGVFAAVLVTAACGGGGASPSPTSGSPATTTTTTKAAAADADPVEWTGTFCEGIGPAVEGVLAMLKTMFEGGAEDPAVQKAALLEYSGKAGKSMTAAGAKLEGLGAPSAEARELHDELVKFFTDSGKSLTEVNTGLAGLDPADPDFDAKLERLGGDQSDPSKLQEHIKKVQQDPQLADAYGKAPQCVELSKTVTGLGG
ncbi:MULTISPECIES: hypothetical protein [Saccharothrix]|uniref:hypothetical protein n=1 Tax=Saccharothrix TaxID=2071 RepID=UPI0009394921|nr:hypothetical protein [Saccharothrix sp. CB00851]OKI37164.1 hypothetical protein A6A25_19265 [Saccharothrix sp. CB00851]